MGGSSRSGWALVALRSGGECVPDAVGRAGGVPEDVDGDVGERSCGELAALLSALAEAPVHQGRAVTGSVNQHGQVQAIGGVNEKIEGFFDVCRDSGLTG